MRRVLPPVIAALALVIVSVESSGAPAPVFKPPTPIGAAGERLLARLKLDGQVGGLPGGWTIFVSKVVGRRLVRPLLKRRDSTGHVIVVVVAAAGEVGKAKDEGAVLLLLRKVSMTGEGIDLKFESKTIEIMVPATR